MTLPGTTPGFEGIGGRSAPAARKRAHGVLLMGLHMNGLGVLHNLTARHVPVIAIDHRPHEPGFRSRYGRKAVCPDPEREPDRLVDFLMTLGQSLPWRPVLLPTNDEFALFVSRLRTTLREAFTCALPPEEVVEALVDKWKFASLTEGLGVAAPRTYRPRSEAELAGLQEILRFPCVLKPIRTSVWKGTGRPKVCPAASFEALVAMWRRFSGADGDLIVQEAIPGDDGHAYLYFAYYDECSRPLSEIVIRKIRQYPPHFGTACLAEGVCAPTVIEQSRLVLRSIGYRGLADVEFKRDSGDGELKIIEVNPRVGLQHELAARSGVDLVLTAYQDLTGAVLAPPAPSGGRPGLKWIEVNGDLESARYYVERGELTFRGWLRSLRGRTVLAGWRWRDPVPFMTLFRWRALLSLVLIIGSALQRPWHCGRGRREAGQRYTAFPFHGIPLLHLEEFGQMFANYLS
jgi:D-aspartate ligase